MIENWNEFLTAMEIFAVKYHGTGAHIIGSHVTTSIMVIYPSFYKHESFVKGC